MKARIQKLFIAFAFLSVINSQHATLRAQGTTFTYQGRLFDGGQPANGTNYGMVFYLYDAPTNGGLLGNLGIVSVTVSNGLFTVPLNFDNVFNGGPRWLEITVQKNGGGFTTLSPRQQLTPAPYAIFAENVGSGGISAGTYSNAVTFNNGGNIFIGSFNGNGAGVTNVNALTLGGLSSSNFWKLGGNAGANPTNGNFIGTTDNLPLELKVNGLRALRLEPIVNDANHSNAVNVINGSAGNFVASGVYGATISGGGALTYNVPGSYTNSVTGNFGTVSGGYNNIAGALAATVSGGNNNTAAALAATAGGGIGNIASAESATVGGGNFNAADDLYATVGGGVDNEAGGYAATVAGGFGNIASAESATISGGYLNTASNYYATVGGGARNAASGFHATVGGGIFNAASGSDTTVAGGFTNTASGSGASVGGGNGNAGSGESATVGGGNGNTAGGTYAVVGGGRGNAAGGYAATVPGGANCTAAGDYSLAAGNQARANHLGAFVWADSQPANFTSTANNQFLIRAQGGVGIGNNNPQAPLHVTGGGDAGLGLGGNIISGLTNGQNLVIDNNEIISRNNGGASDLILNLGSGNVGIGRTPAANRLEVGGEASKTTAGNWLANSDARIKTDIETITNALEKLSGVRLVQFRYTDEYRASHPGVEDRNYLNVIAQEFEKIFPEDVKRSGEKLANGDEILQVDTYPLTIYSAAGLQELNRKVETQTCEKDARISALEREVAELKQAMKELSMKKD
jgi:hypothetical protein